MNNIGCDLLCIIVNRLNSRKEQLFSFLVYEAKFVRVFLKANMRCVARFGLSLDETRLTFVCGDGGVHWWRDNEETVDLRDPEIDPVEFVVRHLRSVEKC